MNRVKNYLVNMFNDKVALYNAECKLNGGHEGSVSIARLRAEIDLIQRQLSELFRIEVEFKRYI